MTIIPKKIVFESEYCKVVIPQKPHITKKDGGHIVIIPKTHVENRQEFKKEEAIDMMKLSMVVGQAMREILEEQGVKIARINYQDNGNWALKHQDKKPVSKIHLYGRAFNSIFQTHGYSLYFPPEDAEFYNHTESFNDKDVEKLKRKIENLLNSSKYQNW